VRAVVAAQEEAVRMAELVACTVTADKVACAVDPEMVACAVTAELAGRRDDSTRPM
jgi:hypothetical protein